MEHKPTGTYKKDEMPTMETAKEGARNQVEKGGDKLKHASEECTEHPHDRTTYEFVKEGVATAYDYTAKTLEKRC